MKGVYTRPDLEDVAASVMLGKHLQDYHTSMADTIDVSLRP